MGGTGPGVLHLPAAFKAWALKMDHKQCFTEKGKIFRRKVLHCLDDRGKINSKDLGTSGRDVRGPREPGCNVRTQERHRAPGILQRRREFWEDKCLPGDIYFFLILLRVVLCKFFPFHNCQLVHIAH